MHITSTTTSTRSTHDIPVLVLASSDAKGTIQSRKFVARPSHYHQSNQDLVVIARKIFRFKNDATLVFGTSTLDVCRGAWIEIDASAYEPLLECLDEVIVRPGVPREDADGDETGKGKTHEIDRVVDPNPILRNLSNSVISERRQKSQPDASVSTVGGSSTLAPPAPSRDQPRTRAEPTATTQSSSKFTPNPEPVPDGAPKYTKSRLLTQLDEMSKQKSKPLSNPRQRKPEPQPEPKPEPERAIELEVEEKPKPKFRPASATRSIKKEPEPEPVLRAEPPRARQRKPEPKPEPEPTEEEDEESEDDERDHPPSDAKTEEAIGQKDAEEEADDFWRFGTKGPTSGSSRTRQEPVPPPSNPHPNSKLRTRAGTMILVEVKKEPEEKGKIRDARARLSIVNAIQLPRASERTLAHFKQDPDERFMVTVHGPRAGQGADFRTRGGHKIKKVLESVCKTFELPFGRSRLVLEDDSREIKQYYCDPEDTVGACGIDADSQLLVQVDGMTDEELNKYGEEEEEED